MSVDWFAFTDKCRTAV